MPQYLAPGVFIEEIERGPKPIEGVATSTAAFLGPTERGPVRPRLITSYNAYLRYFGDVFGVDNYMPYAVRSFFENGGRRAYIARIVGPNHATSAATLGAFAARAVGPGAAGDRIFVRIEEGTTKGEDGKSVGFRVQVFHWSEGQVPFDPVADKAKLPRPYLSEDFDDLSIDPASQSYFEKRINQGNSALVEITAPAGTPLPAGVQAKALGGGKNGDAPKDVQYKGENASAELRTGLAALDLDPYREVAIVHAPAASDLIAKAVIAHCENNRFRFAVVDSPSNVGNSTDLDPRTKLRASQYAAFYYPWLYVSDPKSGHRRKIPPGGAACGIYARTDNSRGVFKAPANEAVVDAIDLEFDIDHRTQESLNPRGVNAVRRFPGRGIRIWGARTLAADPLWKYVSVRRLFLFLEASIYNSTQWVVFEPNDHRLWARVKQTVTLFLRSQWREGALLGAKEEEAFSVAIGRETMTEDDILNGRLIIEVGIAPVRPAEFVIFRVFQKTQEAQS